LSVFRDIARSCGPWWPYEGRCIVTDRPEHIAWDDAGRLHSEDGPAVRYRDGVGSHAIHGLRVPEHVVERPATITLAEIRAERNAELKRILRQRYGDGRYLADIGATLVDVDSVPTQARLRRAPAIMRALMQDDERRRFLVGTDGSTQRTYVMEVPARIATCRQAHEFLGGIDESRLLAQC
jgi:hypothetical protein